MDSTPCRVGPASRTASIFAVEIFEHVSGGGGADVAEDIGAGRGDRHASLADHFKRNRMRGHADADQRTAGGHDVGNGCGARQEQGQGAGPEGVHQMRAAAEGNSLTRGCQHRILCDRPGDVHDDGIPRGALLGFKDAGDGGRVESIGAEAVDGFGGQSDESAGAKDLQQPERWQTCASSRIEVCAGQP